MSELTTSDFPIPVSPVTIMVGTRPSPRCKLSIPCSEECEQHSAPSLSEVPCFATTIAFASSCRAAISFFFFFLFFPLFFLFFQLILVVVVVVVRTSYSIEPCSLFLLLPSSSSSSSLYLFVHVSSINHLSLCPSFFLFSFLFNFKKRRL